MQLIHDVYLWVDIVLYWALVALRAWAIIDCATRKAAAFPAADKLTKPAWLAITIVGGGLGSLFIYQPLHIVSLISVVAALVYLFDVRPAVREVSGGSRW
jgi:hypothetical protein